MSELEVKCRPLILPLAYGHRRMSDLEDKEALLLARWAVKTAYALHSASNWRRVVNESHYQVLDNEEYRLPEGVFVFGHTYQCARSVFWLQSTNWRLISDPNRFTARDHKILVETGYKISLRIGGLFLSVVHNPLPEARLCLFSGRHMALYPRWSHPVVWTRPDKAWPSDMARRLGVFDFMIGLVIENWSRFPQNSDLSDPSTWMYFGQQSVILDPNGTLIDRSKAYGKLRRARR
jgi:hypothetical protein